MIVQFKHVGFNDEFVFNNQKYIKTSFNRGLYWNAEHSKRVYRKFEKSTLVEVNKEVTVENEWMEVKA